MPELNQNPNISNPEEAASLTSLNNLHYTIRALVGKLQRLAEDRVTAEKRVSVAEAKFAQAPSPRREVVLREYKEKSELAVITYRKNVAEINDAMNRFDTLVNEVYDYYYAIKPKKAVAFRHQEEKFRAIMIERVFVVGNQFGNDTDDIVVEKDDTAYSVHSDVAEAEEVKASAPVAEAQPVSATIPMPTVAPMFYGDMRPSINLAPITIDISAYVDRAVAAAMDRFASAFSKRAGDIADATALPVVGGAGLSPETVNLVQSVAESESEVVARMQEIMEHVNAINAELNAINERLEETNNWMQQTNDLQRHTSREQQGIAVNQRVIAGEQVAVAEQQALVSENHQDAQNRLKAIVEQEQTFADEQVAIEETMKNILQSQKDVAATQQSIIQSTAKFVDQQTDLIERQAEVNRLQKENVQAQKQIAREQKNLNEKVAAAKAPKAPKAEAAPAPEKKPEEATK